MRTEELRVSLRLPLEECELLLDRLAAAGWVASTTSDGWVLVRDVSQIRLVDVYREFVFRAELSEGSETGLESLVAQHTRAAHDAMSATLGTLFGAKSTERRKHAA
jgi:DNA-binding IscR family transcriptional regulator